MKRWFSWPRLVIYSAMLLLVAAWYVPQISADRFREPIHAALESALGRQVKIGEVKFRLLPLPGFTISNVIVGEDPAIGAEPVAYVTTLRARPRISALLGGPLAFASVDLEDTSVNLTRADRDQSGIRWNFASFMRPNLLAAFPSVHMIGGRVNFKLGDTKSILYLLNTDVDLWPPGDADGPWTLAVRAEPARTDRPARGFGWFVARGQWHPGNRSITLDVKLEKSELGDMITLFQGQESGLHGHIWGDAHLAGPMTRVGIAGRLMLDDIHGWNQTPPGGSAWPLALGGAIDTQGQVIEIRATTAGQQPPIDLRYRVSDYLGRPRWGVTAVFGGLPMSPLLGIARNIGWNIPADLKFEGSAQGAVGYSMPEGIPRMDGEIQIANSTLAVAGAPPLRVAAADLRFAGSSVTLAPASISNDNNETATLDANYDVASRKLDASLSSEGMSIASLRRQVSVAGVPLLSQAAAGVWSGGLQYTNQASVLSQPAWSGSLQLKNADIPFEAFSQPLHVISADVTIDGAVVAMKRLSFTLGKILAQGEYRYEAGAMRPHRFRINVAGAEGREIENLLQPTLHRGNFLNYALTALKLGDVTEPGWMQSMRADGTIQLSAFEVAGMSFTKLKTRVLWDGDDVRFTGLQGQLGNAAFTGMATVNLAQRDPRYQIGGKVAGLPWRTGIMDAEGTLNTSGTGQSLLGNMSAQGAFRGRNIDLAPLDTYEAVNGCFEWVWDARNPRLKLTQLVMNAGGDTYLGSGEMQDSGQLMLRVSDGTKQIQALGALLRGDAMKLVGQ